MTQTHIDMAGTRAVPANACQGPLFLWPLRRFEAKHDLRPRTRMASCGSSCKENSKVSTINELTLLMWAQHVSEQKMSASC